MSKRSKGTDVAIVVLTVREVDGPVRPVMVLGPVVRAGSAFLEYLSGEL